MKVAGIIQARMGSTRYPGKVLETISNHPVLFHIIERIRNSQCIDVIVVATTTEQGDRILLKRAREYQVHGFAGSQYDLVKRFMAASQLIEADIIVRIPCDNPLFEPSYIDDCVELLAKEKADYCYIEDAVIGTGVDVFTRDALKMVDEEATEPHHREHIITYFKDNPDKFKIVPMIAHDRYKIPTLRLTFDTKEDLKLIRTLYHKFYQEESIVPLIKVINYLRQNPEVAHLNAEVIQKAAEESELAAKARAEAEAAAAAETAAAAEEETAVEPSPEPAEESVEEQEEVSPFLPKDEPAEESAKEQEQTDSFAVDVERDEEKEEKDIAWENLFKNKELRKEQDAEGTAEEPAEEEIPQDKEQRKDNGGEETGEEPEKETP